VNVVLSGRRLCDGLVTRPEESYRLGRVVACDQETSKTRRLKPATGLWKIQPQCVVTPGKQTTTRCVSLGKRTLSDRSCNENQNTAVTIPNTLLSLKVKWTVRVSTSFFPPHSAFTFGISLTTLIIISLHCINRMGRAVA
jgi:hypothetical protein